MRKSNPGEDSRPVRPPDAVHGDRLPEEGIAFGGSVVSTYMHMNVREGKTDKGREEALAATKIQAMWRGYSVYEDYRDAIDEDALFCFLDAYCDDSDGWSATSDGSSVVSEAGEPLVFDDVRSALRFVATLPAEVRQQVEMVEVSEGRAISEREAASPPAGTGAKAVIVLEDEDEHPGIGKEEEGREVESRRRGKDRVEGNNAETAVNHAPAQTTGGVERATRGPPGGNPGDTRPRRADRGSAQGGARGNEAAPGHTRLGRARPLAARGAGATTHTMGGRQQLGTGSN